MMTPQERQMIDDLFNRLAGLETSPRDPEAERAIIEGLRRAPNATYALVQTVLVQDEALKRANAHIEELEGAKPQAAPPGSFLDSMRDAVFGAGGSHGSVPNVRPAAPDQSRPVWNSGQVLNQGSANQGYGNQNYGNPGYNAPGYAPQAPGYAPAGGGGSSFLGTAAAVAAGAIGGSLLMGGIRNLMSSHQSYGSAFGDQGSLGSSAGPWAGDLSNSDMARDAGINDLGGGVTRGLGGDDRRQGMFDNASNDSLSNDASSNDSFINGDDDGFDGDTDTGGDTDYA